MLGYHTRQKHLSHVLLNLLKHLPVGRQLRGRRAVERLHKLVMLGGDHDCVDALGLPVVAVFHCGLAFRVGTQIRYELTFAVIVHMLSFTAYVGKFAKKKMRDIERKRNIILCLVGGIAEHHALVASPLLILAAFHTAMYVRTLLMDRAQYPAAVSVEAVSPAVVAYIIDKPTRNRRNVNVCLACNLSGHHHLSGGAEGFDGDLRVFVAREEFVKKSVADLVGDFVGMSFGD